MPHVLLPRKMWKKPCIPQVVAQLLATTQYGSLEASSVPQPVILTLCPPTNTAAGDGA